MTPTERYVFIRGSIEEKLREAHEASAAAPDPLSEDRLRLAIQTLNAEFVRRVNASEDGCLDLDAVIVSLERRLKQLAAEKNDPKDRATAESTLSDLGIAVQVAGRDTRQMIVALAAVRKAREEDR